VLQQKHHFKALIAVHRNSKKQSASFDLVLYRTKST